MKLRLHFGLAEPPREINWWQHVQDFYPLVLFKGKKWEFTMYKEDQHNPDILMCYFSEIQTYDPNWHSTTYYNIDSLLNTGYGSKCECGAVYTSFPQAHMFYCPKWTKW